MHHRLTNKCETSSAHACKQCIENVPGAIERVQRHIAHLQKPVRPQLPFERRAQAEAAQSRQQSHPSSRLVPRCLCDPPDSRGKRRLLNNSRGEVT
eukprot:scaffold9119_cov32-Tisochrysis_lutea.AAC.1